jgi:8-oxo-dGTP diphosphatase
VDVHTIILSSDEKKILLVRRAAFLPNGNKYSLPGGHLDRNETTEEGALREAYEETGYKIKIKELFFINTNPDRPQEDRQTVEFVYIAHALEKSGEKDHESSSVDWFDLNTLPSKDQFAFDHYETIELYISAKKDARIFPLVFSRKLQK